MKRALLSLIITVTLTLMMLGSAFALDVPPLTGRVVDQAKVLSEGQKAELTSILRAIEEKTTAQVVVLTVDTLAGEDIFGFTQKVFDKWQLGQKDKNNGFLIVVAKTERKFRLHPGYGLEGPIPDAECIWIIKTIMAPLMKGKKGGEDDYFGALKAGIERVSKLIDGEVKASDHPPVGKKSGGHEGAIILFIVLLVVAAIATIVTDTMVAGGVVGAVGSPLVTAFAIGMNPVHLIAAAVIGFLVGSMAWLIVQMGIGGFGGGSSDGAFSGGGGLSGGGGADGDF